MPRQCESGHPHQDPEQLSTIGIDAVQDKASEGDGVSVFPVILTPKGEQNFHQNILPVWSKWMQDQTKKNQPKVMFEAECSRWSSHIPRPLDQYIRNGMMIVKLHEKSSNVSRKIKQSTCHARLSIQPRRLSSDETTEIGPKDGHDQISYL